MLETVRKPNTFYAAGVSNALINPKDLTKEVYDYYWISYSRGTDGAGGVNWNNSYLNGYNQQQPKSIFDPCPYGFRNTVNGTYNKFSNLYSPWADYSFIGGVKWGIENKSNWMIANGMRYPDSALFTYIGNGHSWSATAYNMFHGYARRFTGANIFYRNLLDVRSVGYPLRCIEDCVKKGST